ncbi:hypothetical protein J6590_063687 [Homalodisca vitripennis]|nr:hypothetical protein J6590_063687 [Homalodisca vitripennis]
MLIFTILSTSSCTTARDVCWTGSAAGRARKYSNVRAVTANQHLSIATSATRDSAASPPPWRTVQGGCRFFGFPVNGPSFEASDNRAAVECLRMRERGQRAQQWMTRSVASGREVKRRTRLAQPGGTRRN